MKSTSSSGLQVIEGKGSVRDTEGFAGTSVSAHRALKRESVKKSLSIKKIENAKALEAVHGLVYAAYLGRGYCQPQAARSTALYPHLDGIMETTVFGVFALQRLVGTVSITKDGPQGLNVDAEFKDTCDEIRKEGRALASTWRMASAREPGYGREVAMALIRSTVRYWLDAGIQTCLLTLNPRHILIYKRLLNMRLIARKACLDDLSNAPAVLLRWDIERLPKGFRC